MYQCKMNLVDNFSKIRTLHFDYPFHNHLANDGNKIRMQHDIYE